MSEARTTSTESCWALNHGGRERVPGSSLSATRKMQAEAGSSIGLKGFQIGAGRSLAFTYDAAGREPLSLLPKSGSLRRSRRRSASFSHSSRRSTTDSDPQVIALERLIEEWEKLADLLRDL